MQGLLRRIVTTSNATKKDLFSYTFLKKCPTRDLFKVSGQRVLWALEHIFNKVNRDVVQARCSCDIELFW